MRWRRIVLVTFALVVINLPYGLHELQLHRAASSGIQVSATVVQVTTSGGDAFVDFRLPADVDPKQTVHEVKVDTGTGAQADRTKRLDVRVLSGHPSVFHVDGQIRSWGATIVTGTADLLILLMLLLSWRLGGRIRRPALVAVALGDIESGASGSLLDKQDDGSYVINGQISEAGPESIVLTLRDRDVTIHLQGHHNPLAVGEPAQVRAHMVG